MSSKMKFDRNKTPLLVRFHNVMQATKQNYKPKFSISAILTLRQHGKSNALRGKRLVISSRYNPQFLSPPPEKKEAAALKS
jgi:hypothetical protein